ncbi:MAG TPA: MBL fold metallo-hydrolase, partial [Planctomycetota bacterium]|nr:MBL fold metallo-hydrolase [Planctomycetota bacterium]
KGPVHATAPTRDLLGVMLRDAASIQESEGERRTRHRLRRGDPPVEALYTTDDAERLLEQVQGHPFDTPVEVLPGVEVRFVEAGHILGAAQVVMRVQGGAGERTVVFSGDLGRDDEPLMRPPQLVRRADLVIMESTYGDRDHRDLGATLEEFAAILQEAAATGGNVIIPVFAVGRAQEVLAHLAAFEREGRLPLDKVYLDSPMAIDVTKLYKDNLQCFRGEALEAAGGKLPVPSGLRRTRAQTASMAINKVRGAVVLAASGMCEAGRILHHLKHNLWRPEAHIVFVGYQARGSLGRQLVDGARKVEVMGEQIAVRAKVHTLGGFSAHADQTGLLAWLRGFEREPRVLALTHGEPEKQEKLAAAIRYQLGWRPQIPTAGVPLVV